MSKAWTLFYPQVIKDCYGVPDLLLAEHINNAAIEFCERSMVWQDYQPPYTLKSNQFIYQFVAPTNTLVWKILSAHLLAGNPAIYGYNGTNNGAAVNLEIKTNEWLDEHVPGWIDGSQPGKPSYITQYNETQFVPVPNPADNTWLLGLRVAYKPGRGVVSGPDILYNDYLEEIAMGAKARIWSEPGKSWTNPELAMAASTYFNEAIEKAELRQARAFGRAYHRVKPVWC